MGNLNPDVKKKKKKKKNKENDEVVEKVVTETTDDEPKKKKKKKNKEKPAEDTVEKESEDSGSEESGPFKKQFYSMTAKTEAMSKADTKEYQSKHNITMFGKGRKKFKPLQTFAELGFPDSIMKICAGFSNLTIGSDDLAAGTRIKQIIEVIEDRARESRLTQLLKNYHSDRKNRILIFVLYKKEAARIETNLSNRGWKVGSIHGDKSQEGRTQAVEQFKSGVVPLLVATDVAARGLDIPGVDFVINYSFPLTIEDYVHRIGRTGRAGREGTAHTFFQQCDKLRAGELVKVLKDANQEVPAAMNDFDLNIKKKEHKLYGAFGPKDYGQPMKKAVKITFDD